MFRLALVLFILFILCLCFFPFAQDRTLVAVNFQKDAYASVEVSTL